MSPSTQAEHQISPGSSSQEKSRISGPSVTSTGSPPGTSGTTAGSSGTIVGYSGPLSGPNESLTPKVGLKLKIKTQNGTMYSEVKEVEVAAPPPHSPRKSPAVAKPSPPSQNHTASAVPAVTKVSTVDAACSPHERRKSVIKGKEAVTPAAATATTATTTAATAAVAAAAAAATTLATTYPHTAIHPNRDIPPAEDPSQRSESDRSGPFVVIQSEEVKIEEDDKPPKNIDPCSTDNIEQSLPTPEKVRR